MPRGYCIQGAKILHDPALFVVPVDRVVVYTRFPVTGMIRRGEPRFGEQSEEKRGYSGKEYKFYSIGEFSFFQ